jgi:hypothetical protein
MGEHTITAVEWGSIFIAVLVNLKCNGGAYNYFNHYCNNYKSITIAINMIF